MIIYKDIQTGKELFSDSEAGCRYDDEMKAYIVPSKKENISDNVEINIGANPSAEEEEEQYEQEAVKKEFKLVNFYKYECCEEFKAKSYKTYAAGLQAHYKENVPDKVDEMKTAFNTFIQAIIKKIKGDACDCDLYRAVDENFEGYMPIFMWEGDENGSFYFFKYALEEEKCCKYLQILFVSQRSC